MFGIKKFFWNCFGMVVEGFDCNKFIIIYRMYMLRKEYELNLLVEICNIFGVVLVLVCI